MKPGWKGETGEKGKEELGNLGDGEMDKCGNVESHREAGVRVRM